MADLRVWHDELQAALAEMEALTARPGFDSAELSRVRYRLSRVSGERRKLVALLCDTLSEHATGFQAEQIAALRESNAQARAASTAHIGAWTLQQVTADWEGYCRASAQMRAIMRAQIAAEKAALYPRLVPA